MSSCLCGWVEQGEEEEDAMVAAAVQQCADEVGAAPARGHEISLWCCVLSIGLAVNCVLSCVFRSHVR